MGKLKTEFIKLLARYKNIAEKREEDITAVIKEFNSEFKDILGRVLRSESYILNTDGSSIGNPGDAQIGAVCKSPVGEVVFKISRKIGIATNNEAEYEAVIEGLKKSLESGIKNIIKVSDSELIVNQLLDRYRVRNSRLREKYNTAKGLIEKFERVEIKHIGREKNKEADFYSRR